MRFCESLLFISVCKGVCASSSRYQDLPEGVLHFSLNGRESEGDDVLSRLQRRHDEDVLLKLTNTSFFTTEIEIGSNGQTVQVQIDTGSKDLWVMSPDNQRCGYIVNGNHSGYTNYDCTDCFDNAYCDVSSFFYANESSTFTNLETGFSSSYPRQTWATGFYAKDTVSLGGVTLHDAKFAFANATDIDLSTLGLGLPSSSMNSSSIPVQMKEQGLIKANAYSLWLNDVQSGDGSLLLGGVDHAKYAGVLQTVPIVSSSDDADSADVRVMLHGIDLYQGNKSAEIVRCSLPASLRTVEPFVMLPDQLFDPLIRSIGEVLESFQEVFIVPCWLSGGLTFDFSSIKIHVPFSDLMVGDLGYPDECALGILGGANSVVLGEVFLSSLFAVYDLDNREVALAEPLRNVSTASVEAITSGIPSAVKAPSYSHTQVNSTALTSRATFFRNPLPSLAESYEADFYITTDNYTTTGTLTGLKAFPLVMQDVTTTASVSSRSARASTSATSKSSGAQATASETPQRTGGDASSRWQGSGKPAASQSTAKPGASSVISGANDDANSAKPSSRSAARATSATDKKNAAFSIQTRSLLSRPLVAVAATLLQLI